MDVAEGVREVSGRTEVSVKIALNVAASTLKRKDGLAAKRMPAVVASDGNVVVRLGYDIMPGIPNDIDVLDRTAVRRHLDKVIGRWHSLYSTDGKTQIIAGLTDEIEKRSRRGRGGFNAP